MAPNSPILEGNGVDGTHRHRIYQTIPPFSFPTPRLQTIQVFHNVVHSHPGLEPPALP